MENDPGYGAVVENVNADLENYTTLVITSPVRRLICRHLLQGSVQVAECLEGLHFVRYWCVNTLPV